MTNIRFPLKLPTSGHPNPYTIDFDFLPNNPFSVDPLPNYEPYIYTTKISFNDTSSETRRIEHVLPEGKVYFIASNENNILFENMNILTSSILNNTLVNSFEGIWIQNGSPNSIKNIKANPLLRTALIPSSVIYNSVIIDPPLIQQILNIIENITVKYNPNSSNEYTIKADNPISRSIIIGDWLRGKIGINITENHILNNSILLPISANINQIQIGAISADNNGIEYKSMQGLIKILKTNQDNKLFNMYYNVFIDNGKKFRINPIPLNQFLEIAADTTLINEEIKSHPYRLEYNKYFNQSIWDCIVFNFGTFRQLSSASTIFFENKLLTDKLLRIKIDNNIYPIESSGVFYYPDLNGKQIQVFQNNSDIPLNLFVFINQDIINRADLILNEEYKKNYYYQIGIGVISEEIFQGNLSAYFDIPPNSLANFNLLLDKLTLSCGNTLTVAECFARAMGFIAECIDSELERIYGYMPFRSFLHFNVFILTAYEIFFDEQNKEEFLNKLTFLLDRFTKNDIEFKQKLNNINIKYQSNPQKYDWLKTHGDHNFSDTTEGWKNFGLDNDGGHKHHFIANAMVYNFYTILVPFITIMENHSFFGIEDVEIDRMYNEKGREFASWGTSYVGNILLQYRPNAVYNKIKELIVENETIQ